MAAALLLHGRGVTEVPSASSLRSYNPTCANMLMYWHLLERAVERGQATFDFGRSSADSRRIASRSSGAPARRRRRGSTTCGPARAADMRPDNPRYQPLIRLWRRLPVGLTRWIGPPIVRGIP